MLLFRQTHFIVNISSYHKLLGFVRERLSSPEFPAFFISRLRDKASVTCPADFNADVKRLNAESPIENALIRRLCQMKQRGPEQN